MTVAGQYTDAETGFQYLRARYYDPATGNFLTRDPIEALTREPYGYVGGNPLNATDPLGLFSLRSALAITGAVAGAVALGAAIVAAAPVEIAGVATVAVVAGVVSLAAGVGVMIIDCSKAIDANCVIDAAGVALGAASLGLGGAAFLASRGSLGPLGTGLGEGFEAYSAGAGAAGLVPAATGLKNPHGKPSCPEPSPPSYPPPTYPSGPGYTGSGRNVDWSNGGVPYAR